MVSAALSVSSSAVPSYERADAGHVSGFRRQDWPNRRSGGVGGSGGGSKMSQKIPRAAMFFCFFEGSFCCFGTAVRISGVFMYYYVFLTNIIQIFAKTLRCTRAPVSTFLNLFGIRTFLTPKNLKIETSLDISIKIVRQNFR